jgi:hypothetical protein
MWIVRVENKGYVFHADQVRFEHGGIVFFGVLFSWGDNA